MKSYKYMLASAVWQKYNNELDSIIYEKMNRRGGGGGINWKVPEGTSVNQSITHKEMIMGCNLKVPQDRSF